ncbi:MAG TPA: alanine--glyoxylate aminotransferase family protein [Candidatus Omnitrophota bacterium]|nr:alanine--glyoxylate aminotransferase family protein [Candidatus Omnitrophota bacterium]HPD84997.1 alanine--glyoxylate aminotransferase family protein [Candidatus Omnitrophota bacterium]HRZ03855.1 alanine--glyoxylate aminotransferase family protein [Candidatus Omnitrophota bacterium]
MKRNLLLTPGPTQIPPQICEVLGRPIIHHRTPQFQTILKEAAEGLKYVFQTQNDVFILTSSGTGAMESAVCNLLSSGDKAVCVEAGKFGERWTELCKAYGIKAEVLKIPSGKAVKDTQIRELLEKDKDIKVVFTTLTETSTGVDTNIKAIAEVIKKTNAVLVVDAISGLGATELKTDEWGVDVVVSGSQKGLMLPPGLAFISVSKKAFALVEQSKCPKYYFDLKKAKKACDQTDTPFTPAIGIIIALNESLKLIKQMGLEKLIAHHARLAKANRAAAKALGLKLFADESCISNAVTAICVPDGIEGEKLAKVMRDTHGITMAGGQSELKGKIIRIAQMGCVDEYDILTGISCLEKVLKEMGYKFELGAGVAAAQKLLNS